MVSCCLWKRQLRSPPILSLESGVPLAEPGSAETWRRFAIRTSEAGPSGGRIVEVSFVFVRIDAKRLAAGTWPLHSGLHVGCLPNGSHTLTHIRTHQRANLNPGRGTKGKQRTMNRHGTSHKTGARKDSRGSKPLGAGACPSLGSDTCVCED